jgi:hypothetical protein
VTDISAPSRALGPRYYGHGTAATLQRAVANGTWLSVDLGRTIKHYRSSGSRFVAVVGRRAPFATCASCGTFAEISYTIGSSPFCSTSCMERS